MCAFSAAIAASDPGTVRAVVLAAGAAKAEVALAAGAAKAAVAFAAGAA